jgi:hypothetical protein
VLKGPANACLYPDPYMRQVGDIDLWVDGGRKSVLDLLKNMGYEIPEKDLVVPHHVHLHPVENGISVEIHFCPSSGIWNPFSGARLLRFLEKEIQNVERVSEGFCVPTMKFALVMQLAHIQRHFVSGGIGFKQIIDYYILLVHSTEDDLREISNRLSEFGLLHGCRALMWVLGNVFGLDKSKMLCKPNEKSGRKMLAIILEGGNFGFYAAERLKDSSMNVLLRWLKHRLFFVRKMWYSPFEVLCRELDYWFHFIKTIGLRIKTRRFSLWSMYHNKANSDRRKSLCEK